MMQKFYSLKAKIGASVGVFFLVTTLGFQLPLAPPATVSASARIWIQQRVPDSNDKSGALYQSFMTYFNSPLMTACQVIKSRSVLDEAVNELKTKLPENEVPTADSMQEAVTVEPVSGTDILEISYRSNRVDVPCVVLQSVIDSFLKLETSQATSSSAQARGFFASQLEIANKELSAADERVERFQAATGVFNVDSQVEDMMRRRAVAQQDLTEARAKIKQDSERESLIQKTLGVSVKEAADLAEEASDPAAMSRLAQLQAEYSELSTVYKPEHPRMRQLQALMSQLQRVPSAALPKMGVPTLDPSVPPTQVSEQTPKFPPGGVRSKRSLAEQLAEAKSDEASQFAKVSALQPVVGDLESQIKTLPPKQVQFAELLRMQRTASERVATLEASLNSAKLLQAMNEHNDTLQVIDPPRITGILAPSRRPKLLGILLLGLFMGAGTFVLLELLDPRVRRISTVIKTLPLSVIGCVPELGPLSDESLEAIHKIRLSLRGWIMEGGKQIIVTSGDAFDGKAMVASGLALSFAQAGTRVLLVDANQRRPSLHNKFVRMPQGPGLAEFLANPDQSVWTSAITEVFPKLKLLRAGEQTKGIDLLASENIARLEETAQAEADLVIYNTPPTSDSAAALALMSPDAYLLVVVRMNHTQRSALQLLSTQLRQHRCAGSALVLMNTNEYKVAAAITKRKASEEETEEELAAV